MSFNGLFSWKSITQNSHSRSYSFDFDPPLYHIIPVYGSRQMIANQIRGNEYYASDWQRTKQRAPEFLVLAAFS